MFGFRRLERKLDALIQLVTKGFSIMSADFATLLQQIDDGTNAAGARLAAVQAQLADLMSRGAPPTQAQLDEMGQIVSHLQAMATDPNQPVPPVTVPVQESPALKASKLPTTPPPIASSADPSTDPSKPAA